MQEAPVQYLDWKKSLEKEWHPTPVFLPGNPMDRGAWWAIVQEVTKIGHNLMTKQ